MSIYAFAPKAVINNLSQTARTIIETRITDDKLKPYMTIENNIRIRGLKPSILYTQYSLLNRDNVLETMYITSTEEEQCKWVIDLITKIKSLDRIDIFLKAMTEMTWCIWEDKFMYQYPILPLEHLHCGYKDINNNTFVHCIAYACVNKQPTDIDIVEEQFQALKFTTNEDMYSINDLGETPLKIIKQNSDLLCFTESILLRLPPDKRLQALSFDNWDRSWDTLMRTVIEQQTELLIEQTKTQEGFLTTFMYFTFNDKNALNTLFTNGYKLKPEHIYKDKMRQTQKYIITQAIINNPSWHNLTVWMYLIIQNIDISNHLIKLQNYLKYRINLIKMDIITIVMHPKNYINIMMMNEE
jgi:hypothetical protein